MVSMSNITILRRFSPEKCTFKNEIDRWNFLESRRNAAYAALSTAMLPITRRVRLPTGRRRDKTRESLPKQVVL